MKVPELKKILKSRGINCSGKNKEELVQLAAKAVEKYDVIEPCDQTESE